MQQPKFIELVQEIYHLHLYFHQPVFLIVVPARIYINIFHATFSTNFIWLF